MRLPTIALCSLIAIGASIALGASIAHDGLFAAAPADTEHMLEQAPPTCPRPPFDDPPFCYPAPAQTASSVAPAPPATRTRQG